jgi:hypothetical protein
MSTCVLPSRLRPHIQTFKVGWQYNDSQVSLMGKLYLDGESVLSRLAEHPSREGCRIFSTLAISKTTKVPFMFSALELTGMYLATCYNFLTRIETGPCQLMIIILKSVHQREMLAK